MANAFPTVLCKYMAEFNWCCYEKPAHRHKKHQCYYVFEISSGSFISGRRGKPTELFDDSRTGNASIVTVTGVLYSQSETEKWGDHLI